MIDGIEIRGQDVGIEESVVVARGQTVTVSGQKAQLAVPGHHRAVDGQQVVLEHPWGVVGCRVGQSMILVEG